MHRPRRTALAALAATAAIALAGCWPAPAQGPDRRAHNPFEAALTTETVAGLEAAWTAHLPSPSGQAGTPVVSSGGVHVTDRHSVATFDRASGEPLWHVPDEVVPIIDSYQDPVVVGDRLLVSSGWVTGEVGAWNHDSDWRDPATGAHLGEPGVAPVTGVRGSRAATFTAPGSGYGGSPFLHTLQVRDLDGPGGWSSTTTIGFDFAPRQPATLGAERLYFAGSVMEALAPGAPSIRGVHAFPVEGPTTCHEPPPEWGAVGPILCTDWSTPTSSEPVTPPVLGPGEHAAYVGLADGTVLALDAADGSELWRADLESRPSAAPALADGWLYVPLAGGDLAVLDAATGALAWSAEVGGAGVQPAVAGRATPGATGVVVVGTDAGELLALPAAGCGAPSCEPLWRRPTYGPVTGAPAVTGGRVYAGLGSPARVTAFALPAPEGGGASG